MAYDLQIFGPVNSTRHKFQLVDQVLNPIKKWLVTPITFMSPYFLKHGLSMNPVITY